MNSPQEQASLTNLSLHTSNVPIFFRWSMLFSQLPSRPFVQGVGMIVAWLLLFLFLLHPVHAYLDHTWGLLLPRSTLRLSLTEIMQDVVIEAPFLETWVFQKCVFTVAGWVNLLPNYSRSVIVLSAVLFALSHFYSVGYIVYTFPLGCLFGSTYWYGGCTRRTFWIVVVAHATFNGLCFLFALTRVYHPFSIR